MGKKQEIKSLVNSIALVAMHKLVAKHTKKPESLKHLENEVGDYSVDAFEKAEKRNWTKDESKEIEIKALKETKNRLLNKYPDIKIEDSEIIEFVIDTIQELLLE